MNVPFPNPPAEVKKEPPNKGRRAHAIKASSSGPRDVIPLLEPTAYTQTRGSISSWSSGNAQIDSYIRESAVRNKIDPYLIFCLMDQESSFKLGAVSPKGARGLMQLMPATAVRFGVQNIFDPRENIEGGAKYLRFLMNYFGEDRLDLVVAGYNAGEGAVLKYAFNVPPYLETQNYVRRILWRYNKRSIE
jgi:soluble lytic murein transglycosylase-like protein